MANQMNNMKGVASVATIVIAAVLLTSKPTVALDPLVDTGVSSLAEDGRHVAVSIPAFFNMVLDTRGPSKGFRLTESVMSGLVKINMDREKGADGKMKGPIQVNVAGMTVYNNNQQPLTAPA